MLKMYCPEMKEKMPVAYEAIARPARDFKHYFVDTYYPLTGRGITFDREATREGWSTYYVTEAAFNRLAKKMRIVMKEFLD